MKSIEHQFRKLAFAQVLLGMLAFCIAEGRLVLLGLVSLVALVSWFVTEGPRRRGLDRMMLNVGAVGTVVLMTSEALITGGAHPVALVGHFTMALQVLLLFAKKTRREYIQLAVLSPLQMIGASVLPGGVTLVYGMLLLVYCFLALLTALTFQLKSAGDLVHNRHRRGLDRAHRPERQDPISGPYHRMHFRLSAVVIGLCCGVVAAITFIALPRARQDPFAAALVSMNGDDAQKQAGFNTRVLLTGGTIGGGSPEPVLNVAISQGDETIGSENRSWLIRGAVQDHYEPRNRTWSRPPMTGIEDLTLEMPDQGLRIAESGYDLREAAVTLRRRSVQNLFTVVSNGGPIAPVYIRAPGISRVSFNTEDQQLDSKDALAAVLRYRVQWRYTPLTDLREQYRERLYDRDLRRQRYAPDPETLEGPALIPEPEPTMPALRWPVQTERVRELARRVLRVRELPVDYTDASPQERMQAAQALADHLRRTYQYTLENPSAGDTDPVIGFLFTTRAGHCELFASGLAALCRTVGIPARLATGYRASEYNSIGGYYVVRESHAHAWAEVDLGQGAGWHTIDPTPPSAVDQQHGSDGGWLDKARALYDHLEFNWIATVITYDKNTQEQLLGTMGNLLAQGPDQWARGAGDWVVDQAEQVAFDTIGRALALLILLSLLTALVSLVRLLVLRHRRMVALQLTALPRAQQRILARQLRFYVIMLETLERYGRSREHWQSPFQFARELADLEPLCYEPVLPLTEMFYEVRFGYRELDSERQSRVRLHLRRLEQNLAAASRG